MLTFEITGQMDNGEPITGTGVARLDGNGTIEVGTDEVTCTGTYDSMDMKSLQLTIPLTCSNGMTGVVNVTRNSDLISGYGTFVIGGKYPGTFEYFI